jgi:putative transposase
MGADLVETTLNGALDRLGVTNNAQAIFHTDQGSQYLSGLVGRFCEARGITQSTGRVGTCYDNAGAESFFATIEKELIARTIFETREQARIAVFEFIETWYNTERLHSTLEYRSPATFEQLPAAEQQQIMQRSKQKAEKRKQKRLERLKQQRKMQQTK